MKTNVKNGRWRVIHGGKEIKKLNKTETDIFLNIRICTDMIKIINFK